MKIPPSTKTEIIAMVKKNPLMFIGGIGLIGAILFTFTYGNQPPPKPNQLTLPPSSPYQKNISGLGLVEASSKNISVGTFLPGIVAKVFVIEGNIVKKGSPLFQLDSRSAEADVKLRMQELETAKHEIAVMASALKEAKDQYDRTVNLKGGTVISIEEKRKREFGYQKAEADVLRVQADYKRAEASLESAKITLDKMTVTAPTDGLILKVYTKVGESVGDAGTNNAVILMGNHIPLHLRVQLDENDAWRFKPNTKAMAYLKSNKDIAFPLSFVRIEPFASPKQQLSGDITELVDTRIVDVVFEIKEQQREKKDNAELPPKAQLYIGQQMDVFIETDVGL